jgi:hypothetical protein
MQEEHLSDPMYPNARPWHWPILAESNFASLIRNSSRLMNIFCGSRQSYIISSMARNASSFVCFLFRFHHPNILLYPPFSRIFCTTIRFFCSTDRSNWSATLWMALFSLGACTSPNPRGRPSARRRVTFQVYCCGFLGMRLWYRVAMAGRKELTLADGTPADVN